MVSHGGWLPWHNWPCCQPAAAGGFFRLDSLACGLGAASRISLSSAHATAPRVKRATTRNYACGVCEDVCQKWRVRKGCCTRRAPALQRLHCEPEMLISDPEMHSTSSPGLLDVDASPAKKRISSDTTSIVVSCYIGQASVRLYVMCNMINASTKCGLFGSTN